MTTEINAKEERAKATFTSYSQPHFDCIDQNNNRCNCKINKTYHIEYAGKGLMFYIKPVIDISINGLGKQHAHDVVRLFTKNNLPLSPYFLQYAEIVRKQDNPTPEEIEQDRINREIYIQNEKQEKEKRNALNILINNTKASSRLEKLKQKHIK